MTYAQSCPALRPRRSLRGLALGLALGLAGGGCSTTEAGGDEGGADLSGSASGTSNNDGADDDAGTTGGLTEEGDATGSPTLDLPPEQACDPWAQDCGPDEKCSWEVVEGEPTPRCVPLEADASGAGEPCMVFGNPGSGHDDCELGFQCLYLDANNQGSCVALCAGSELDPSCAHAGDEDGGFVCQSCVDCPSLCMPLCNPLTPECGPGFACLPDDGAFTCAPARGAGSGMFGEPCEYSSQCAVGHACVDGLAIPACEGSGCCAPFCDLLGPECPPGLECVQWFDPEQQPDFADVGVCMAP